MRKKKLDPSKAENASSINSNMIETLPTKVNDDENKKSKRDTDITDNKIDRKSSMKGKRRKKAKQTAVDSYFCDTPSKIRYSISILDIFSFFFEFLLKGREYSHFVLERIGEMNSSLFDFEAIYAMCDLEIRLTNVKGYDQLCQVKLVSKTCCRPWSIPNYFALLSNRSSCVDIEVSFSKLKKLRRKKPIFVSRKKMFQV